MRGLVLCSVPVILCIAGIYAGNEFNSDSMGCPLYTAIYDPDIYKLADYQKPYIDKPVCRNFKYAITHHDSRCDPYERYRSLDGTCNNLFNPDWGSAGVNLLRWLPAQYDDGVGRPRLTMSNGEPLPLARRVSTLVHDYQNNFHPTGSVFLMQWGQFLSHDFAGTPRDTDGLTIPCCDEEYINGTLHPDIFNGGACFPVIIPEGDRWYTELEFRCRNFVRSRPDLSSGVREQSNIFSAYIDGTTVYGLNDGALEELRNFTGGRLNTIILELLPESDVPRVCRLKDPENDYCMKAGDFRVNMYPPLGLLHTIFVRLHNYIADQLALVHTYYDDEKLFQEARRIVIAIIQRITYEEYLPAILGRRAMNRFGLRSPYRYNPKCDASLHNAFLAAAFRFGHSMIPDFIHINGEDVNNVDIWLNPASVIHNLDSVANGSFTGRSESADRFVSLTISDRLFERSPMRGGDLISTNIQRGRDHGTPGYNAFRRFCNLDPIEAFDDLPNGLELRELYADVEDIELFPGGLSERPVASLGPTLTCLNALQFRELRDCDRFFWENPDPKTGFTAEQREAIRGTSLSDVICLTTGVSEIQRNAFIVNRNRLVSCERLRRNSALNIRDLF